MRRDQTVTPRGAGARPWVAGVELVALSAAAHVGAGGDLPGLDGLLAIWLVAVAACLLLHHRLLRVGTAAAVATAGQVVVHLAGSTPGHGSHVHATAADPSDQMLLAHVVSAVATVLVLLWQESAVRAVVRLLVPVVARRTTVVGAPATPSVAHRRRPQTLRDVTVAPFRGPPVTPVPSTT